MSKYKLTSLLIVLGVALFSTGCATKTKIKAVKAGKVTDSSIKNVGVMPFDNDKIGQSSSIDSTLSNVKFNGKKYFNVIDRKNIEAVMKEKVMNDSGLVKIVKEDTSGGLEQMTAMVTGSVDVDAVSQSSFLEGRTDYNTCVRTYVRKGKTYCSQYRKYNVSCKKNTYDVKSKIKLVKVENAQNIFTQSYDASHSIKHCTDDSRVLQDKSVINAKLAKNIAASFARDIAPSYVYFTVTVLDKPKTDLKDLQEAKFKSAVKLIEINRVKKAGELLSKLNNETQGADYAIVYDLAITQEAQGKLVKALNNYKKAENLMLEVGDDVKDISYAIQRTEKNLAEQTKANKQVYN